MASRSGLPVITLRSSDIVAAGTAQVTTRYPVYSRDTLSGSAFHTNAGLDDAVLWLTQNAVPIQ